MSHVRLKRVESAIRAEISNLIVQDRLKDPRIHGRLTVTDVELSRDLKHAKIFVSHLGDPGDEARTLAALTHAAGYIQSCIARNVRLRYTPKVSFVMDHSIERGVNLVHKINNLFRT